MAAIKKPLSPPELLVLTLLAAGMTDRAIAGRLGVSAVAASKQVARLRRRYGAASRTELAVAALEAGDLKRGPAD